MPCQCAHWHLSSRRPYDSARVFWVARLAIRRASPCHCRRRHCRCLCHCRLTEVAGRYMYAWEVSLSEVQSRRRRRCRHGRGATAHWIAEVVREDLLQARCCSPGPLDHPGAYSCVRQMGQLAALSSRMKASGQYHSDSMAQLYRHTTYYEYPIALKAELRCD